MTYRNWTLTCLGVIIAFAVAVPLMMTWFRIPWYAHAMPGGMDYIDSFQLAYATVFAGCWLLGIGIIALTNHIERRHHDAQDGVRTEDRAEDGARREPQV